MAVEGTLKCVKYLMFLFNLILAVIGLIFIIAGALAMTKFADYVQFLPNGEGSGVCKLLIAIGVIVFIVGFFGCCGAYRENTCFLFVFAAFLIVIFLLEVGAVIFGIVMKGDIETGLKKGMQDTLLKYGENEVDSNAWNSTQIDLKCCGVNGYKDYNNTKWFKGNGGQWPDSCCKGDRETGCGAEKSNLVDKGCYDALLQILKGQLNLIVIIGAVVAFIQVLGIICSCCLISGIRKNYEHV